MVGDFSLRDFAQFFDHTALKPDTTADHIEKLCAEALEHHFAAVCVNPCRLRQAANLVKTSKVMPITVVGFPLGASSAIAKAFEVEGALKDGAQEIDTVLNIGFLKDKNFSAVQNDIHQVVKAAQKTVVKVILETSLLTPEEVVMACKLSVDAGALFVKTSTGFGSAGATAENIALMRKTVGPHIGVKASGGVRSLTEALQMIAAGASRIGSSNSVAILEDYKNMKGLK